MHTLIRATHAYSERGKPAFTVYCSVGGRWATPTPSASHGPEFGQFMSQLGARRIYLPNPREFNAQVLARDDFIFEKNIGSSTLCWAPRQPADGTLLGSGEAGLYTAAGCPIIVAMCDDQVAFAHAGQRCLLDTARILGQPHPRTPTSVVGALIQRVAQGYANSKKVYLWVYWSIPPNLFAHRLDHETHSAFNHALVQYLSNMGYEEGKDGWQRTDTHLHLDLPRIIATQATQTYGVPERNVHIGKFSYISPDLPTTRTHPGHNYIVAVVRH